MIYHEEREVHEGKLFKKVFESEFCSFLSVFGSLREFIFRWIGSDWKYHIHQTNMKVL